MESEDFYSHPKYYEIAFGFRGDCKSETDFFEECMRRHSTIPVKRVLEIASGPSPHLKELARRGYEYIGVDLNPAMLDYAREKAKSIGAPATFLEADMRDFRLDVPADFAYVTLGSLYVESTEALLSHFHSVAASLRSGGLYVLHWCIEFVWDRGLNQRYEWTEQQDGVTVSVVSSVRDKLVQINGDSNHLLHSLGRLMPGIGSLRTRIAGSS